MKCTVKDPHKMAQSQLADCIQVIRLHLWVNERGEWDRDKPWTVDLLDEIAGILESYGLAPEEAES